MPNLTKDDIEHYFNIFAKARENANLNRYGNIFKEEKE